MKANLLKVLGIVVDITPIGIYVALNWEQYAPTTVETIKMSIGSVLALILIGAAIFKKVMPKGTSFFFILFVIAYLLQVILSDLVNLTGMILIGVLVDSIFVQPKIDLSIENKKMEKQAKYNAEAIGGRSYE